MAVLYAARAVAAVMARRGVGHGVEVVQGGASQNRWHRDARGTGKGRWIGTGAAESLTCGSPAALFWTVRRVALGACGGGRAALFRRRVVPGRGSGR